MIVSAAETGGGHSKTKCGCSALPPIADDAQPAGSWPYRATRPCRKARSCHRLHPQASTSPRRDHHREMKQQASKGGVLSLKLIFPFRHKTGLERASTKD